MRSSGLGECVIATDLDGTRSIVQADPVIGVSGVLLHDWHDGTPDCISLECAGDPDHIGDVIRVDTADRRVVYVVTRLANRYTDVFEARWPD